MKRSYVTTCSHIKRLRGLFKSEPALLFFRHSGLKPQDRIADARFQQVHPAYPPIKIGYREIVGTEPDD